MPSLRISGVHARSTGRPRAARCLALLPLSGLLLTVALAPAAPAQESIASVQTTDDPWAGHIAEAARRFDIPQHWIRAVLHLESAGDPQAISVAGAMGLMQIMPGTWSELRGRYALGDDPFLPRDNIIAGTAYLRELLDRYGTPGAMLAAYNAGPRRYDDYLAGGTLPAETRAYVAALAPLLGDETLLDSLPAAAAKPADWREAGLFIAQSGDMHMRVRSHGESVANAAGTVGGTAGSPHAPAAPEGLFASPGFAGVVP